uniref:Cilia and flagella associated protein 99 n=1 Tax=Poecilia latipinna TaxID=48699 RepID=A0A3B3U6Q0_9TELE
MSSEFGSLVKVVWMLLDKFSSDCRCVDEFIEDVSTDLQVRKFILDVFSGCVEYEKLLDIVVNTFYGQHRKWLCKSDRNQFIGKWRPEINHLMDQLSKKERRASAKPTHCQDFILSKNKLPTTPKREPSPPPDKFTPVRITFILTIFKNILQQLRNNCFNRIDKLVQGAIDPSPFLQRQKELEERERQEKRQAEERTRLETQIIEKEITLIRKRIAEQKHEAALRKKEETARLMQRYAEKRVKEEKEVRDLVQQVMEHRINLKVAQERSKKIKQKIVKEVSEENQELLRQALEEKEEELRKRFQIIHEIHVIESLPIVKSNKFDETETAGHELLGEMSLAELKERLALLRQNQQKEEEERRSNILEEKQKKKQQILETLDNINLYRKLKEEQRSQQELLKQVVNEDETIVALKKKLEDKKQAFHKMKEAERSQAKPGKRLARRASGQVRFLQGSISLPASTSVVLLSSPSFLQKELRETTWEELEQSLARFVQNTK